MDFSTPKRRSLIEPIIPMINVVFILLIFFLMTAQIRPADPWPIAPPKTDANTPADAAQRLTVSATGEMSFADQTGDAVWAELAQWGAAEPGTLLVRADAAYPAAELAALLARLSGLGIQSISLATVRQ